MDQVFFFAVMMTTNILIAISSLTGLFFNLSVTPPVLQPVPAVRVREVTY